MKWLEINKVLRAGGRLHTTNMGPYVVDKDGVTTNVRPDSVKALMARDLVVIVDFDGNAHYTFRHKYENKKD